MTYLSTKVKEADRIVPSKGDCLSKNKQYLLWQPRDTFSQAKIAKNRHNNRSGWNWPVK